MSRTPSPTRFRPAGRRLVERLRTPRLVQRWLDDLAYNRDETLHTFRGVVRQRAASCVEAVVSAATILEQHGHEPVVLDLDSQDGLGHVLFLYQRRGLWGAVGRSRDPGLHGRKPAFRTIRELVDAYAEPYVDFSGRIVAYAVLRLDDLTRADWRLSEGNVWSVERALIDAPHRRYRMSEARYRRALARYRAFRARHPDAPATDYAGKEHWL